MHRLGSIAWIFLFADGRERRASQTCLGVCGERWRTLLRVAESSDSTLMSSRQENLCSTGVGFLMTDAPAALLISRSHPSQYLIRNGISNITRDHFSFSAKIKVGDFYEARDGPQVRCSTVYYSFTWLWSQTSWTNVIWFSFFGEQGNIVVLKCAGFFILN